jgi:hypothetical protein
MKQTCISPPSEARVKGRGCSGLAGWLVGSQAAAAAAAASAVFNDF